jgi:hypothetical protein
MRRAGLALAAVLLLGACVSDGEKQPTPTTRGVPPEGYRRALAAATRPVQVALGGGEHG